MGLVNNIVVGKSAVEGIQNAVKNEQIVKEAEGKATSELTLEEKIAIENTKAMKSNMHIFGIGIPAFVLVAGLCLWLVPSFFPEVEKLVELLLEYIILFFIVIYLPGLFFIAERRTIVVSGPLVINMVIMGIGSKVPVLLPILFLIEIILMQLLSVSDKWRNSEINCRVMAVINAVCASLFMIFSDMIAVGDHEKYAIYYVISSVVVVAVAIGGIYVTRIKSEI